MGAPELGAALRQPAATDGASPAHPFAHASRAVRALTGLAQVRTRQLQTRAAQAQTACAALTTAVAEKRASLARRRENLVRARQAHLETPPGPACGLAAQVAQATDALAALRAQCHALAADITARRAQLVREALRIYRVEPPRASLAHARTRLAPPGAAAPTPAGGRNNEWTILGLVLPPAAVLSPPAHAVLGERSSLAATLSLPEINGAMHFTAQLLRLLSVYTGVALPFVFHLPGRPIRQRTRLSDSGVGGEVVPNALWGGGTAGLHPPPLIDVWSDGTGAGSRRAPASNAATARPLGPLPLTLTKEAHNELRARLVPAGSAPSTPVPASPAASTLLAGAAGMGLGALGGARTGMSRLMESFVHLDTGDSSSSSAKDAPPPPSPRSDDAHAWTFICALAALAYNTAYLAESQGARSTATATATATHSSRAPMRPLAGAGASTRNAAAAADLPASAPTDPAAIAARHGAHTLRTLAHLVHAPALGARAHDTAHPPAHLTSFAFYNLEMAAFVRALVRPAHPAHPTAAPGRDRKDSAHSKGSSSRSGRDKREDTGPGSGTPSRRTSRPKREKKSSLSDEEYDTLLDLPLAPSAQAQALPPQDQQTRAPPQRAQHQPPMLEGSYVDARLPDRLVAADVAPAHAHGSGGDQRGALSADRSSLRDLRAKGRLMRPDLSSTSSQAAGAAPTGPADTTSAEAGAPSSSSGTPAGPAAPDGVHIHLDIAHAAPLLRTTSPSFVLAHTPVSPSAAHSSWTRVKHPSGHSRASGSGTAASTGTGTGASTRPTSSSTASSADPPAPPVMLNGQVISARPPT